MAVATGFRGRTVEVQEPRTGVPRIDLPGAAADPVFPDAKAFLSSSEARQMSESELERELHPAGPGVGTQAPARTSRPTQPGRDCRSGRGRQRCRVLGAVRARKSHGNDLRHDAGCASGLRAAPRPASARCRAEPAAGALLVRDAPRDHRDRLAGTTAYALEATVVLDIIHVAAAMRRAVLVAGSSKGLSACRPRLAVLKAPRVADALMRTETFHEAREYQRKPPSGR